MRRAARACLSLLVALSLDSADAQSPAGGPDAGGYPAPTPALERGRTVYVLSACHFCHGVDLTQAQMGAADLMRSPLVGADRDGDLIGPIVLAGLPNLQTAMPRYADFTREQITDLARYVHYLRQQGRYKELMTSTDGSPGDARAGQQYFEGTGGCAKCHADRASLSRAARKYEESALRAKLLKPASGVESNATPSPGHEAHLRLLENYAAKDVHDLVAYLKQLAK